MKIEPNSVSYESTPTTRNLRLHYQVGVNNLPRVVTWQQTSWELNRRPLGLETNAYLLVNVICRAAEARDRIRFARLQYKADRVSTNLITVKFFLSIHCTYLHFTDLLTYCAVTSW